MGSMLLPGVGSASRLLVVDDDVIAREIISAQLAKVGWLVVQADDVACARAALGEHPIDLALVDINLPDGTGFDFVEALRRERDIAVIYMTTRNAARDRLRGLDNGGDDYVVKPVDIAELRARIRAVLRRYGQAGARRPVPLAPSDTRDL